MKKILFAIKHQAAEKKLSELISSNPEYKIIGTMVSHDSILDFLEKNIPDILIYREELAQDENEDAFEFIINLKLSYPEMRIIFVAGDRSPGDTKIPLLITYAIYDILAGNKIVVQEMANLVFNPQTLMDVKKWLPGKIIKKGIFSNNDLESINSTETTANQENKVEVIEEIIPEPVVNTNPVNIQPKVQPEQNNTPKRTFGQSLKERLKKQVSSQPEEVVNTKQEDDNPKENSTTDEDIDILNYQSNKNKKINIENKNDLSSKDTTIQIQPQIKEIKVPSRSGIEEREKLLAAEQRINKLEKQLQDSQKKAEKTETQLERTLTDYLNLEKQVSANSKQRIVSFYGAMPGVGTTTIALNVANYLAMKNYKVIYIEFNDSCPTLSYWYDLSEITEGIEKAVLGIEARAYQEVNKNIITKQMILELGTDMKDKHEKYPPLLHYMFFSDGYIRQNSQTKIAPNTLKDLLMLLLYKEGYDYIILDVYPQNDYNIIETATMFSTTNVFVMTQDVVTIGASLRKFANLEASGLDFEMLRESESNKKNSIEPVRNFKNFYVINKYNSSCLFNRRRINDWLQAEKKTFYVPENSQEIYNATYKALPVVLTSKNMEFVTQIKNIAESI